MISIQIQHIFHSQKKCCQHSFNCMALNLRSVKCQYFLSLAAKKIFRMYVLVFFLYFVYTLYMLR